jgi:nitroimidazol reductase NimA-like FMN-containing flavoprotein (pyridoxamine 5'-phosphate oxidase superfamily)
MFPIRMQKRACTDADRIRDFLNQARTGFLGLSQDGTPYVIPLNFVWQDEAIYFHGAQEGRKVVMMQENPRACFTISEEYGTIADPVPAHIDTAYMSVVIHGSIEIVSDPSEATEAMQDLIDKYVPGYYSEPLKRSHLERYVSSMGSKTAVFKLLISSMTAKENEPSPDRMYYTGRTVQQDRA